MNKREMITKGEALVANLKALEQYYQKYLSTVPKLEAIDISWTKQVRSRLMPRITALSDAEAEKATFLAEIEKDYEKAVKAIGRLVASAPEELEKAKAAELADHKAEYEALLAAIRAEQLEVTYPPHYATDKEFERLVAQRRERVAGGTSIITMAARAIDGSLDGYKRGIASLSAQTDSYLDFNRRLKARAEKLYEIERPYIEALRMRAAFFDKVSTLRKASSTLLTALGKYDASLLREIQAFQRKLSDKDTAQKAISFLNSDDASRQAKEWAKASEEEIAALNGEYIAITDKVYTVQQRIASDVTKAVASFNALYEESQQFLLPPPSLAAFKQELDTVSQGSNPGEPEIVFLSRKLETIANITTRFLPAFHAAEESAKQTLRDTISAERSALVAFREQFIRNINNGGFKFNEQEASKLTAFAREIITGEHLDPQYRNIKETYDLLMQQKEQIAAKLHAFEADGGLIHKHRKAQYYAEGSIFSTELAGDIEKLGDGSLLSLIAQYIANDKYGSFLSSLSDKLHLFKPETDTFNFKGIAAVRQFIASQREHALDGSIEGKLAALEKKLDFFDLLSSKGIDARPFYTQPAIITAVAFLKEMRQEALITEATLRNQVFCEALTILKTNGIEITAEQIGYLSNNPDNCKLIINQNKYHREEHAGKFSEDTFKAILKDCITTDPTVAKAYNAMRENSASAKYATPGILMLLKENEILRTLLGHGEEKFNQNLPLLVPLLEELFKSSATFRAESYIKDYLSDDISRKNLVKGTIDNDLLPHNEFLTQLKTANENEHIDLPQMGKLMGDLNTFIENLRARLTSEEDKQALSKFRKAMIPILLTERTIEEKQGDVEALATEHFQAKKELWQQVLTGLAKVFQTIISSIFGVRFAPEKPEHLEQVKSSTQQAFGAVKAAVSKLRGDDAEASDKEGEGEGPHAS
jgi:hypothetical protein